MQHISVMAATLRSLQFEQKSERGACVAQRFISIRNVGEPLSGKFKTTFSLSLLHCRTCNTFFPSFSIKTSFIRKKIACHIKCISHLISIYQHVGLFSLRNEEKWGFLDSTYSTRRVLPYGVKSRVARWISTDISEVYIAPYIEG